MAWYKTIVELSPIEAVVIVFFVEQVQISIAKLQLAAKL